MKKDRSFEDDGRVIADMNFEGAPWYEKKKKRQQDVFVGDGTSADPKETFRMMKYATLAGLSIALVFILACFLFIMFSLTIWFR
jgi:hypothetical protein